MRPISRCLNTQLLDICQRVIQLDELNAKLNCYLPSPLRDNCQIGSFNKGCLIINTSNSVWATELHYRLPVLRDNLRKEAGLYQLASIKIAITEPRLQKPLAKVHNKHSLSAAAQEAIQTASEQCAYLPLKKALERLVR